MKRFVENWSLCIMVVCVLFNFSVWISFKGHLVIVLTCFATSFRVWYFGILPLPHCLKFQNIINIFLFLLNNFFLHTVYYKSSCQLIRPALELFSVFNILLFSLYVLNIYIISSIVILLAYLKVIKHLFSSLKYPYNAF